MDNNKNYNNNNKRPYNGKRFQPRPKNLVVTLPLLITGKNSNDVVFDSQSLLDILAQLEENETFKNLAVSVSMSKKDAFGDDTRKGNTYIGYIRSIDVVTREATIVVYANQIESYNHLETPHVFVRNTVRDGKVGTILGFDVCNKEEHH